MKVLVTGATGFVGRALVLRLLRDGHTVTAFARSPARARTLLGGEVAVTAELDADGHDAVVNLAGSPIAGRWTARRRTDVLASRIDVTERVVASIAAARRRPSVLVSASAVGYYGDRGDEEVDETSAPGAGFLADVCKR